MRSTQFKTLGLTRVLFALSFAWCFLMGAFCGMMLILTLAAGDGLQVWTLQGVAAALIVGSIGWVLFQVYAHGWDGWREMLSRARREVDIRLHEWRQG